MSKNAADVEAIFFTARHKQGEARAAYLDEVCGDDRALRRRVEQFLGVQSVMGSFLDSPAVGPVVTADELLSRGGPGTVIGPYKLLEVIGEGGFGVVFMAEQLQPVRRKVALKVIKPGMDSKQVIARFEAERQALALMDHPNIARVLDADAPSSGRPYFVMELVRGVSITQFCDANCLAPRKRLELFVSVCQAVQHAHTKGVIHRDLKPGNVLVTLHDGTPVVKVIDFGIAKAIGQALTEKTLFTGFAQMIGTPLYMSPEQAEMSGLDVDTRCDIYSLGVLLYELLTGTTPFDGERLRAAGYDEMRRIIREEEPARPSHRVSTLGGALTLVSEQRQTDPRRLGRLFRGEVDWIVMKALEKERGRRYETASALAADVLHYLHDEPVQACPPSMGYRLRKFVRRHKGPVLAAALVVLALVGGIIGTSVGLVRAEQARQAEAERAEGERIARDTAEKRLAQVEKGIDVIGSIFANLDPLAEENQGRPLRAILGDRLDEVAAKLEGETVGDPLGVAKLQVRLGETYLGLGQAVKAEALFARAHATRQVHLGADHALTLAAANHLASAQIAAGKGTGAIALLEHVKDVQEKTLGADDLAMLATLDQLGTAYRFAGQPAKGAALLEQVLEARRKKLPPDHPLTLDTLDRLVSAYVGDGKAARAVPLAEQVRDAQVRKYGEDSFHALKAINNLAMTYQAAGKMRLALNLLEEARKGIVPKLGPEHPHSLTLLNNLAWMYRVFGRTGEAIALAEQVRETQAAVLGARHPATLMTLHNLALAYQADGQPEKALSCSQQAATGVEKLEYVHSYAGPIVRVLCKCLEQLKQHEEAEGWRRKWLNVVQAKHGPDSEDVFEALQGLGANLLEQKKYADAESLLLKAYQGLKEQEPNRVQQAHGHPPRFRLTEARERLVRLYDAWGKKDQADEWRKLLE